MTRMFLQEERGGHKRHTQLTEQPRFQHPAQMLQEAARAEHPAFFHPHFSLPKAFLREAQPVAADALLLGEPPPFSPIVPPHTVALWPCRVPGGVAALPQPRSALGLSLL